MVNRAGVIPNTNYQSPTIIYIVGPTASGKSKLAMNIASRYNGEIICADSQTVRLGLDIGTAKPSKTDQKAVKHHLLDVIGPYDKFSVAEFKTLSSQAIKDISKRGKLPIIVGGTGLYIDALLYDFPFRGTASEKTREELENMSVQQLQVLATNRGLDFPRNSQNPRHLIRTIESQGQASIKRKISKRAVVVGLDPGKEKLEIRIQKRISKMMSGGFLNELESVIAKYGLPENKLDAIGYAIAMANRISTHEYNEEQIIKEFNIADRQYAKKQRSWFKRNKDIKWFEQLSQAEEYIVKQI